MKPYKELKPDQHVPIEYEEIEKRLKKLFREEIYYPLLKELELPQKTLKNDTHHPNALQDALFHGTVTYNRGTFSGKFNSSITKALRDIGARFDRRQGTYKLNWSEIPIDIKNEIASSEKRFTDRVAKLDSKLQKILPDELADKFKAQDLFSKVLWKADDRFKQNIKNITVAPELTKDQRNKIALDWQNNMKLWIKGWTEEEIKKLRKEVLESTFKGNRWGTLVKTIQDSYGVSAVAKAKFLARQETNLLVAKFKEVRFTDAGIHEYKWACVNRPRDTSPDKHIPGNVRYTHGLVCGKFFRWDDDREIDENGNFKPNGAKKPGGNNPQQDYNCRCFPVPRYRPK